MKNKLGSISKRDVIFISIVLFVLLAMIAFDTDVDILVNYDEAMLMITSPRQNIDISHSDILSVELIDMPELGTLLDGFEHKDYCTGNWVNDTWGEYLLCVIPSNTKCILVKMDFPPEYEIPATCVFTCTTDEKTLELFESYCTYRENLAA